MAHEFAPTTAGFDCAACGCSESHPNHTEAAGIRKFIAELRETVDDAAPFSMRHRIRFAATSLEALVDVIDQRNAAEVTEYLPVIVCREGSPCVRRNDPDEDGRHQHVLDGRGMHATEADALDHARRSMKFVYGPEHDVKMLTRTVTPWVER